MGWLLIGGIALVMVGLTLIFRTRRTGLGTILALIGIFLVIWFIFETYGQKKASPDLGLKIESSWQT